MFENVMKELKKKNYKFISFSKKNNNCFEYVVQNQYGLTLTIPSTKKYYEIIFSLQDPWM